MFSDASSNSLVPAKMVSVNTGEPVAIGSDVANFDSATGQRKNPNVSFAKVAALGSDSPSPMKLSDFRRKLAPLEKVQEEEIADLNASRDDNPETCPEPPQERSVELASAVRAGKKSNSDVESQLEAAGIKLRESELDALADETVPNERRKETLKTQKMNKAFSIIRYENPKNEAA